MTVKKIYWIGLVVEFVAAIRAIQYYKRNWRG